MMNSPTWRSQRPATLVVDGSSPCGRLEPYDAYPPSPLSPDVKNREDSHSIREHGAGNRSCAESMTERVQRRRHADSGIYLGRDREAMSIVGIHPFSEIPDSPTNTFILSAAVSHGAACPQGAIIGELQRVVAPSELSGIQSTAAEDELSLELAHEDEYLGNYEADRQSSQRFFTHSPDDSQSTEAHEEQGIFEDEERKKDKERDIHQLIARDKAIQSVNSQHASPRRHDRPDSEDRQRFRGLLGRLHCEIERSGESRTEKPSLNDPAIISFAPKKSKQHSTNKELSPQLHDAERRHTGKKQRHVPSDSGYASPTTYSRPSTRAQSRSGHGTSDDIGSEPIAIQHVKFDSKNYELDSTLKHSTLNPAAKAFSLVNDHSCSPAKIDELALPPVPDHAFFPPPQAQGHLGAKIQSPGFGFTALPNFGSPLANLALIQPGLLQLSSATLPQTSPFSQAAMPPPHGFGLTGNIPSAVQNAGIMPGLSLLSPPSGMGLPGLAHSPGIVSASGPISSEFTGAFHHQLPSISSCNNPAHQTVPAFSATQGFQAPMLPQLAPPVPPAFLSPGHSAPVPPFMAPAAPVVNPIFGKNVPKPKVPNTTGQQYWEYWHELRRTFEPGYAQKSKQNQQKRYMKQQVYKNGGTTDQP